MSYASEARFRAIQLLQAIRARHHPGSKRYEQVEHAIDLALSERRAVDEFFVRNLLRDAMRILDRQSAARHHVRLADDVPSTEERDEATPAYVAVEFNTPEAILSASQTANAIVADVSRSSRHAAQVMEGLLTGDALADTADKAAISIARVNQLRQQLREIAGTYLGHCHDQ